MIDNLLADAHPSPAEQGRAALLQALGCSLPEEYLSWVEKYGGSSLEQDIVLPDENGNAVLATFYDAEKVARTYVGRFGFSLNVPRDFVAVAYGPGGGLCIRIASDDFGSVWFADYDLAGEILGADEPRYADDAELPDIMTRLADNWSAFINSR